MANDTNKKLTITDKNLISHLNDCVIYKLQKIGTFFPDVEHCGEVLYKIIDNHRLFIDGNPSI